MSLLGDLRFARRILALLLLVLGCVPLHYLSLLLTGRSGWPPRFLGLAARACGVRARLSGTPLAHDVFFLSNHVSWLDILILGGVTRTAFIAKAELEAAPVVGWLAAMNGTIYVKREDRRAMPEQIAAIRAAIGGAAVTIFPEGTTGDGRTLLPFKASLLQVLDPPPPGMRVQPLFLDYGIAAPAIAWGDEEGAVNARRILRRPGTIPVTVRCLEPFAPDTLGRKGIAAEGRARIAAAMAARTD